MNEEEYEPAGKWWVVVPIITGLCFVIWLGVLALSLLKHGFCS